MTTSYETTTKLEPFVEILATTNRSPDIHPQDDLYGFSLEVGSSTSASTPMAAI